MLRFTISGVLRGVGVGGAAGLTFALLLTGIRLTSPYTLPAFLMAVYCVVATSIGALLGAAVGGVIALTGYGRPSWLPAIGGVLAACGWLAWNWRLYNRPGGLELSDWIGHFVLVLPFAAAAGVLHGSWLKQLRMPARPGPTRPSTG